MRRHLRNRLLVIFLLVCMGPFSAFAQAAKPEGKAEQKKAALVDPDFSYTSKDRRDPFEPVFLTKVKQRQASGALKEGYEMEELKLVGMLNSGGARFAMMEDTQGKGLLFKQGDFINKTTWIMEIDEEKVTMAYRIKGDIRKFAIDIPRK
ncbi:MAG TPA: pilus assembly protein PilP [Syntrophorhabdales bacterium]|nr:pilus assembly protein PilP [Syntrophorhabdales bacterium]